MLNWLHTTLSRMPAMTWWDILDITIVSVAIYEILKAIRGTRAVQMAVGCALLVLMFYISRWGHLQTVDWTIRNLLGYVVFAAIVLFQADIRRALAHFGRAPFFRYFLTQEGAEETIEEIAVAATQLSAQRVGAIIIVERQIGLRNYIEAGLPLDAMLTYDLLVSIFQPKSPLHDGAVIVQNDRVAAAACFLPLTINPQLARSMGTRHRAAIGLTEENDAVAVIVSEETGRISIALDGQIEGPFNADQLRTRLKSLITPGATFAVREARQPASS
jgi:diadenylate cyclase